MTEEKGNSSAVEQPTAQTRSIIALGQRGLQLTTFDELYRFSEFVIKAGLAPRGIDTKEKVFLALQYAMEMGMTPMVGLQNSMVVNNRVSFYGELVVGQMQSHPEYEDMKVEYSPDDSVCTVTIVRKGHTPSVGTFTKAEAQHLINDQNKKDTWGKYTKRMLFWRAFSRAKVVFSDVLKGVKMPSDIEEEGFDTAKPAKVVEVKKPEFNGVANIEPEPRPDPQPDNRNLRAEVMAKLGETPLDKFLTVMVNNRHIMKGMGLQEVPDKILATALDDWEQVETELAEITK